MAAPAITDIDVAEDVIGQTVPATVSPVATRTVDGVHFQEVVQGLVPTPYDYVELGYSGSNLSTVTYKQGGSGGDTVATLSLGYSGGNLSTISRS